ncbi:hypothetical protein [Alteromonas stellipolaris]|uniref:hypothetical protein n=1 Tax=Alteromonas stellipolaris TaxID=233316 RepID=UPI0026E3F50F|nr:hypothetical protein [Alteromonas stellipolaris]MDO6536256.1 hypothetical protein [Alteromonas stellipolaris]MDO6627791.1 hypothetical protein [Alteromonas stellipolaris]
MKWILITFASLAVFLTIVAASLDVKQVTMHTALRACDDAGRVFLGSTSIAYNKSIMYHPHSLSNALNTSITGAPDTESVIKATQNAYEKGETGGSLYTKMAFETASANRVVMCYFEYYVFGATDFRGIQVDTVMVPEIRLTLNAADEKRALEFIGERRVTFIDRLIAMISLEYWEYTLNSQ